MGSAGNGGTTGSSQDESYQLLAHPEGLMTLPFAMTIRLTPEILKELKNAEAEGAEPRMKFGDNVGSHVIEVGHETFMLLSTPEPGDLCDIYKEQMDENGQKMLREAGSAWRKLSVQRILIATEEDCVKQCMAEAEKKQKLRKFILEDQNTQISIPQAALAEVNTKKPLLGEEKEPPPKKRKVTKCRTPSVKKQSNATALIGNYNTPSPASPSPELMSTVVKETPGTPLVALPCLKGKPTNGGEAFGPIVNKPPFSQKGKALTTTISAGSKINNSNIRNLLISLLQASPKGMTIKALEKAVTEGLSVNPERKLIEKIIKSIATYHAPGKYILNPGVEKGTLVEVVVGSSGNSHDTSCVSARDEEPLTDLMVETICQKAISLEQLEVSYNKTHDFPAKPVSPQPVDSQLCITNELDGRSSRPGETDATAAGSRGSDSSITNESESESEISGNGNATSASESSSGSESDVSSSSSSEANMDEDVDIMSDDEDEKRSDIRQQKSKAEDVKLSTKGALDDFINTEEIESGSLDKHNPSPEIQPSFPGEVRPTSDNMKVREPDCMDDSLLESVFGPDEDAGVMLNGNAPLGNDNLKISLNFDPISSTLSKEAKIGNSPFGQMILNKEKGAFSETPDSNQELQRNNSRERRKRYGSDQSTSLSHVEARAGKRAKQLDILVDKISEDKDEISDRTCVKSGAHQSKDQKPSCKIFETAQIKNTDQHLRKGKARHPTKKANSNSVFTGDNLSSKKSSFSLEASKKILFGSSLKTKDRLQKVGRPSREVNSVNPLQNKQHTNTKPDSLTTTNQRKKYCKEADKYDAIRIKSSECNDRVSSQIASSSSRPGENSSLDNNVKGFSGKDDDSRSKEGVSESSMPKRTNSGETSARQGKSVKAQQCPRKDAGENKATLLGFTKELQSVQDALELARINKEIDKASRPNSLELAERTSSVEDQVEEPLKDTGFFNRGREYGTNDGLKKAELTARPPNTSISTKDGGKMETRIFLESKRNDSQDLELGEFREPPSENEPSESRRLSLRTERQCFEATSRETSNIKSVCPDSRRPLPVSKSRPDVIMASPGPDSEMPLPVYRSRPDVIRASPGQGENSLLQELHSEERITRDAERAEPYRPLRKNLGAGQPMPKLGADQVKQSHRGRSVSANKDLGGSPRSGGSDLQNHRVGSKETSSKHSNKLLGDSKVTTLTQQKASNAISFPEDEKHSQNHTAKDLQIIWKKKQTIQSSEIQGGEFFAPYERKEPELRETIFSLDQFREYYKEFNEKYPIYAQLNTSLENDKENFEIFRKDIEEAKRRGDMAKLTRIHGKIRKEYFQCHKRSKRMRHTFKVLHEELQVIKQHCKDYTKKLRRR